MSLRSEREAQNTRNKLGRLEERYRARQAQIGGNARVRELTMVSLKRLINQLTEELIRYETRQSVSNQ